MCTPARHTRNGKDRSEEFFRDTKHGIYKSTVEVYICTDILEQLPVLHNQLACNTFNLIVKFEFVCHAFLLCKSLCKTLQDHFSRIRKGIDCMSHTIDQPCMVKGFFIQHFLQIFRDLFVTFPVFYICLQICEHILDLQVGTAMTRTLQ